MFIIFAAIGAVLLVTVGYAVLWSSYQPNLPKNMSVFGKVLSVVIFVMAGLVLASGIACRRMPCCRGMSMHAGPECPMAGKMQCRPDLKETGAPGGGNYDKIISDFEKKKAKETAEKK